MAPYRGAWPGWGQRFARVTLELRAPKVLGSPESIREGLRKDGKPMMGRQRCQRTSSPHLKGRRKTVAGGDRKSEGFFLLIFFSFLSFQILLFFFFFPPDKEVLLIFAGRRERASR